MASAPLAQNGSPCCTRRPRMEICRCPLSHLISLLLFLFPSETACHPSGRRTSMMQAFRIWDVNQKTFYMRNNQLVAGYLQGSNTKLEVNTAHTAGLGPFLMHTISKFRARSQISQMDSGSRPSLCLSFPLVP
ncbi:interleukin-1 receptor antagonist protein isoform X3 [Pipistrellus kuhlii]|uniref:interleukin-1 receptor antagonist protein isoform X3 n=1 Tax=Pipistrellus kuhlii TaxID=59472 RepID=UPI00174F52E7|nr:interleukin-1 receptor antagonist protein isoform X3 [Pipistrellus kuhlii]